MRVAHARVSFLRSSSVKVHRDGDSRPLTGRKNNEDNEKTEKGEREGEIILARVHDLGSPAKTKAAE